MAVWRRPGLEIVNRLVSRPVGTSRRVLFDGGEAIPSVAVHGLVPGGGSHDLDPRRREQGKQHVDVLGESGGSGLRDAPLVPKLGGGAAQPIRRDLGQRVVRMDGLDEPAQHVHAEPPGRAVLTVDGSDEDELILPACTGWTRRHRGWGCGGQTPGLDVDRSERRPGAIQYGRQGSFS